MKLSYVAHSETGPVRKNNQDSGYASPRLLVVADGMGGAAAGDLASAVAVDQFRRVDERAADVAAPRVRGEDMLELLAGAITRANDTIADLVTDDPELEGMGTTVSAYMFDGERLGLAHIGDSRAYLLRDGALRRTTHDHSWVQSLIDEGKITEEEANSHPHRNLLLKVLNGQSANEPDLELVEIREGDRLLVCSDGLSGLVDDAAITAALLQPDLAAVLAQLIELAHEAGGIDNITIVLADVLASDGATGPGESGAGPDQPRDIPDQPRDSRDQPHDSRDQPRDSRDQPRDNPGGQAVSGGEAIILGAATERSIPTVRDRSDAERAAAQERLLGDDDPVPDEEHARYAPTSPPRWRWLRVGVVVLAVGVVLLIAGLVGNAWMRTQYYVGAAGDQVAIYQGLPDQIADLPLSDVFEETDTLVTDLPRYYRQRVGEGIRASDLPAARNTAQELRTAAQACIAQRSAEAPLDPRATPSAPGQTGRPPFPDPPTQDPTATLGTPSPLPEGECE